MARSTRRNPVRRSDGGAPKKKTTKKVVVRSPRQRGVERDTFKRSFELEVFYRGFDRAKDKAIAKAARKPSEGSGMMLVSNLRDMRFEFKTETSALLAAYRIGKAVRGVRCMLRSSYPV